MVCVPKTQSDVRGSPRVLARGCSPLKRGQSLGGTPFEMFQGEVGLIWAKTSRTPSKTGTPTATVTSTPPPFQTFTPIADSSDQSDGGDFDCAGAPDGSGGGCSDHNACRPEAATTVQYEADERKNCAIDRMCRTRSSGAALISGLLRQQRWPAFRQYAAT